MIEQGDERRHPPGPELHWAESWSFDFTSAAGDLGGWARLTLLPNRGVAWYHAFLTGPDRQLAAVIDDAVPLPTDDLELRTTGLWATHICETPFDHWTIGLEAFALGVDEIEEIYGRQFGDRVPLGFDLEWESVAPASSGDGTYRQPCEVSGEILVGAEEIDFVGVGWRDHTWGLLVAWDRRWLDVRGSLDDGTRFSATVLDGDLASATATVDGEAVEVTAASQTMAAPGIPAGARVSLAGLEVGLDPRGVTPLEIVDVEGRRTRAPRALCRVTATDGRVGNAWVEWNEPTG